MAQTLAAALKPRKQPRQARSQVTVDAVFEAALQVLLTDGPQRLTTTRVAERAGVSVGTLYQYYPNKQALLYSVLARHLARIGDVVEAAAQAAAHAPLSVMVAVVVDSFVRAKTERLDEAQALYAVAGALDADDLVKAMSARGQTLLAQMLSTASDARFDDVDLAAAMFTAALSGVSRSVMEGGAPAALVKRLSAQLESLCLGYLQRESRPV